MALSENDLVGLFEDFHRHPELSFEEVRTTERIREVLSGIDGVELLDRRASWPASRARRAPVPWWACAQT